MKAFRLYIFLFLITLILFNVNAISEKKLHLQKRDDVVDPQQEPTNGGAQNDDPQPTPNPEPQPSPEPAPTTQAPQPVPTTQDAPTPDPTPAQTPGQTTGNAQPTTNNAKVPTPTASATNSQTNQTNANKINTESKKSGGLSGGVIAGIIVGGIFALGVVILIFRALIRACTKKNDEYPVPVLNVVNQGSSSEQLNPNQMVESGQYYNQSSSTIPTTGVVVGIDDNQQYYQQPQQGYDNADISNQYQQNDYQNGYVDNMNGGMDYPQPQEQVTQPVRNFSSLRRPNATGGMNDMPSDGYNQMMNGEITDAGQGPRKVIINKTNNTPIEPGTIHKTQFPFTPNMDDELRLNAGDAVEIIEVYDDGWSYGKNMATNEVGVFPISYITGYNDPSNNF